MAKRTRGTIRPGQRAPIQRSTRPAGAASPEVSTPASSGEPSLVQPAGSGLASLPAEPSSQATAGASVERSGSAGIESGSTTPVPRARLTSTARLSVVAEEEYRYVSRDVRRIGVIGGSMFGLLAIAYIAIEVIGVGR